MDTTHPLVFLHRHKRLTLIETCLTVHVKLKTFPRLSAAISGGGRVTKSRRLYPGYHLSTPEKPDLYSVPSTVPDTDSSSAVRFNTCVPGANLPAKVKMKEDTVQVQTEYSTYCGNTGLFPERTKEIADQERSFQNKPECKHQ